MTSTTSGPLHLQDKAGAWHRVGVATVDIKLDTTEFVQAITRLARAVTVLKTSSWVLHTDVLHALAEQQDRRERRTVQVATRKYRARRKR